MTAPDPAALRAETRQILFRWASERYSDAAWAAVERAIDAEIAARVTLLRGAEREIIAELVAALEQLTGSVARMAGRGRSFPDAVERGLDDAGPLLARAKAFIPPEPQP